MRLLITEINERIKFQNFDCENEDVNEFLESYALKNHNNYLTKVYVLINKRTTELIGFMTLSAYTLRLPNSKKYEIREIPAILLGRIGIDKKYRENNYAAEFLIPYAIGVCNDVMGLIGCRLLIAQINQNDPILKFFFGNNFDLEIKKHKRYCFVYLDLMLD